MACSKNDIISQLKRDILLLQGYKPQVNATANTGLGPLTKAFPNNTFPTGIHEFISIEPSQSAATGGFVAGLIKNIIHPGSACLWISSARTLFPPALKAFGLEPDRVIFVDLLYDKDVLWATEEALKCEGLSAVVAEVREISFTASRRLQLAIEHTGIPGFILRQRPRNLNPIASVARWNIRSLPSEVADDLPGVGLPRFQVALLKIRNGTPASWALEWNAGRFVAINKKLTTIAKIQRLKTG